MLQPMGHKESDVTQRLKSNNWAKENSKLVSLELYSPICMSALSVDFLFFFAFLILFPTLNICDISNMFIYF